MRRGGGQGGTFSYHWGRPGTSSLEIQAILKLLYWVRGTSSSTFEVATGRRGRIEREHCIDTDGGGREQQR